MKVCAHAPIEDRKNERKRWLVKARSLVREHPCLCQDSMAEKNAFLNGVSEEDDIGSESSERIVHIFGIYQTLRNISRSD